MMKNLTYVDRVKGIGIIAVVMLHSGLTNALISACISSFIMPLFFMTSGILLQYTQASQQARNVFYGKKVKTLLVPYMFFGVCYLIMGAIRGYTKAELFGIIFENITLFGNSVLWFLPCLFIAQAIVYEIYRKTKKKSGLVICALSSIMGYVFVKQLVLCFPKETLLWQSMFYVLFAIGRGLFAAGFIGVGYWLNDWIEQIKQVLEKSLSKWVYTLLGGVGSIFLLVLWVILAKKNGPTDFKVMAFGNMSYYFIAAVAAIIGMIIVCRFLYKDKILAYCGKYSLIIMLTHLELQFLNVSIKCGEFLQVYTGRLGNITYWFGIIGSMILLEVITIYMCNHYFAFVFGKKNLAKGNK